ncbi:MAG: aminotransferase class V-fold PLP-dependent enzyme [Gammaproteobacteria bacterium]|nr:aminotransferase class V-fold PLP-dependent enzyme [Gammaproteobacteria bacterium]
MTDIKKQIREFESASDLIEPGSDRRHELFQKVNDYTEEFLQTVNERNAYIQSGLDGKGISDAGIHEEGVGIDSILEMYKDNVEQQGISTVSGKFMGYIAPCSMFYSALGDYIAAITDPFSVDYSASPGAVRMEKTLLDWMANLVGYPQGALGNLASGGSMATLICLVTARESHKLKARDYDKSVVYMTDLTHHCFKKGLLVAGMGECIIRKVAVDEGYRMRADALKECVEKDRERGLLPWLVIGSAGTTDLGNVDPFEAIADVAAEQKLWFHIDGAYGGFFVLSDLVKEKFKGMNRSDSIVMNPHKPLYTPFGLGAALVKNGQQLYEAHHYTASYLQDNYLEQDEVSPADLGPELTRHFRALRLWLPLKLIGVAPFRAALNEKILLTRYAYERMAAQPGYEMGPYPELSTFAFRVIPEQGDVNEFNRQLITELRKDGRVFLSSTLLDSNYMIRVNVLSYRTHIEEMDLMIEVLNEMVEKIK